jgi:hypothetical protein
MLTPPQSDVAGVVTGLSEARKRNLLALPSAPGAWATVSEMRSRGATGSGMDLLFVMNRGGKLCDRRWTKWGSGPGQKPGEGHEYTITPFGVLAHQMILAASQRTTGDE